VKPLAIACLLAASATAQPFLFTSFRGNGESGVSFALSDDGRRREPVRGERPVVPPRIPGRLMCDPFLVRGPDGRWHMLWTTGWTRSKDDGSLTIGCASSSGLIHWSWQKPVPVPLEDARNARAPEAVWRPKLKQWIVFWASTVPGRFPESDASGGLGYDRSVRAMRTRDFATVTKPELFFDSGSTALIPPSSGPARAGGWSSRTSAATR
jgi:hypothetical protein